MSKAIALIVEGKAEVESVPLLIRKLLARNGAHDVSIARPFRVKRNRVVREGEMERAVQLCLNSRPNPVGLIVLLDADDDCPARLGPTLLGRCRSVTGLPVFVVLASRELESWFLGAKESLRGVRGIRGDATAPEDPEGIRGAKERLSQNMMPGRYIEVDDQPALAARMDPEEAARLCPSFARFRSALHALATT